MRDVSVVLASIALAAILAGGYTAVFTDRHVSQKYANLLHLRSDDVRDILGPALVDGNCSGQDWRPGFSKPSIDSCYSFWVYQERYGIFYIFFNEERRVMSVQYRGG